MKHKLLPPLPPFVDRRDPRVMAWQIQTHEDAIEHLQQHKIEAPNLSYLPTVIMVITWGLGILGLVSPAFVAQVLRALLH